MTKYNREATQRLCPRWTPGIQMFRFAAAVAFSSALSAQQPQAKPEELPPNVEKIMVKTSVTALREVPFYLRVPKGDTGSEPRRVLFICPVHNGNGLDAIKGLRQTKRLIETAEERRWYVLSVTFNQGKADVHDRKTFYYYPEAWSGKAVLDALEQVKRKYSNVDTDAILLQGFSGGAQFVHRLAIWAPERVVAVAVNSTSWFDAPKATSCQTAWLLTIGESDPSFDHSLTFLDQLRKVGVAPIFRSYAGMLHEGSNDVDTLNTEFLKFYDYVTRPQLGKKRSLLATKPELPMKPEAMPFVGDSQDWLYSKNAPDTATDIAEDSRVFLPSDTIARLWGKTALAK